jgi:TRAP-type mannitol/chloroaromatic compound transport system permease small subunit
MEQLVRLSNFLDKVITKVAKVAAWAGVGLILVTVFDVVSRRYFVLGSTKIQELEWHLHVVLFALCLGFAYLKDSHVRIDIIREQLSERAQWWIELFGCVVFLLPYCALVVYFSYDFTVRSFEIGEISASATGLSHRWIIKAAIPIGFALLGLSGIVIVLRKIVELFGPPDLREIVHEVEEQEIEHLDEITDIPLPVRPVGTAGTGS